MLLQKRAKTKQISDMGFHASGGLWFLAAALSLITSKVDATPLRIVSITPAETTVEASGAPVEISGDMSIIATFNHAMIALGSDFKEGELSEELVPFTLQPAVKGHWRWVTTSVLRFDPIGSWPTELDLELHLKDAVVDYSGNSFDSNAQMPRVWRFTTPPLYMYFSTVSSKSARAVTGGRWDASVGSREGPEVPPDGVVTLQFSDDVELELVKKSLVLASDGGRGAPIPLDVQSCRRDHQQCVAFTVKGDLAVGTAYKLKLPAGVACHSRSGKLRKEISLPLRGLLPFTFPFVDTSMSFGQGGGFTFRRQRLWLRHGLAEWVTMPMLLEQFKLKPTVKNLTLARIAKGEIELAGEFQPGQKYELQVLKNERTEKPIQDGFGLLLEASGCRFEMAPLNPIQGFDTMGDVLMLPYALNTTAQMWERNDFEARDSFMWPVVYQGKELSSAAGRAANFEGSALVTKDNIGQAIATVGSRQRSLLSADNKKEAPASDELSWQYLPMSGLSLHMQHKIFPNARGSRFGSMGQDREHVQSAVMGVSDLILSATCVKREMLTWLMRQESPGVLKPVADGALTFYRSMRGESMQPAEVLARMRTNEDGLAILDINTTDAFLAHRQEFFRGAELWAVAQDGEGKDGKPLLVERLPPCDWYDDAEMNGRMRPPIGTIVTDRGVYKPGDSVLMKIYVREATGGFFTPAANEEVTLEVHWGSGRDGPAMYSPGRMSRHNRNRHQPQQLKLNLTDFGSAEVNITVPADTSYAPKTVSLSIFEKPQEVRSNTMKAPRASRPGGYYPRGGQIAAAQFVIADPRPPTVSLAVSCGDECIVHTNGTHPLARSGLSGSLDTTTQSGVPVANSAVTLRWMVSRTYEQRTWHYNAMFADDEPVAEYSPQEETEVPPEIDNGEEKLVTDANGHLTWKWLPENFTNYPTHFGDSVELTFEWVGPTREVLTKTIRAPIAFSEVDMEVMRPNKEVLPKTPFQLDLQVRQHYELGGAPKAFEDVSVELYEASEGRNLVQLRNEPRSQLRVSKKLQECTVSTSASGHVKSCDLSVPEMGHYLAVACTGSSPEVCSSQFIGKNSSEWAASPLKSFLRNVVEITTSKEEYGVGDTLVLNVSNPYEGSALLAVWRGAAKSAKTHSFVKQHLASDNSLQVDVQELGEDCVPSCRLAVMLLSPSADRTAPVPTSAIFDPRLPEYVSVVLEVNVRSLETQKALEVELTPQQQVAEPGSEQKLAVKLRNADGSPAKGEVCIMAIDRSMLDVKPHPLVNLTTSMRPRLAQPPYIHLESGAQKFTSQGILDYAINWMRSVQELDPWALERFAHQFHLHSSAYGMWGTDTFDRAPEAVLRGLHGYLTQMATVDDYMMEDDEEMEATAADASVEMAPAPMMARAPPPNAPQMLARSSNSRSRGAPMPIAKMASFDMAGAEMAESAPMAAMAGGSGGAAPDGGHQVRLRNSFAYTPLFRTVVVDGSTEISWQLPDNIGKFELRAFAASEDPRVFSTAVSEQVVQPKISASPSVPRMSRVGDSFSCGVTVTVSEKVPEEGMDLSVVMELVDDSFVVLQPAASASRSSEVRLAFHPQESTTKEAVFPMNARSIGTQRAVVTILHGSQEVDKLELLLPVMTTQPEVYVATSVSIPGTKNGGAPWEEGVMLPPALNGTGQLHLSAGVGHLPAVAQFIDGFFPVRSFATAGPEGGPTALELLSPLASLAALAPFPSSQTAAQTEKIRALLDRMAGDFRILTNHIGLRYSHHMVLGYERPDVLLNAVAVLLLRRIHLAQVELPTPYEELGQMWQAAVRQGLEMWAREALEAPGHRFSNFEMLAAARLALGRAYDPGNDLTEALSFETLYSARDKLSMLAKAELALLLMLPTDPAQDGHFSSPSPAQVDEAKDLLHHLASCLRVTGRTAYITSTPNSAHAADLRTNAMALTALSMARLSFGKSSPPQDLPLANIDKLAKYVAQGGGGGGAWGMSAVSAALALADYDHASHNTEADLHFEVLAGSDVFYSSDFKSDDIADASSASKAFDTPFTSLPPLLFEAQGVGEVSVGLGLHFVPAEVPHQPIYRGMDVQRIIQRYSHKLQGPIGAPLTEVALGTPVIVTLQISVTDDTYGVIVEDWLPAGLEAFDPNLEAAGGMQPWGAPCWGGYYSMYCSMWSQETKKDRVLFHASFAYAGTHTVTYQAMAVTRGSFVLPPAKASAVFEPEVMGMSIGGVIVIADTTRERHESLPAPKTCPHECSGRGTCDTSTGTCTCFAGSAGQDCSEVPAVPTLIISGRDGSNEGSLEVNSENITLKLVAGAAKSLQVVAEGSSDSSSGNPLRWLFASVKPVASRHLRRAAEVEEQVVKTDADAKSGIVNIAVSSHVTAPTTASLAVSGSADGSLFGSKLVNLEIFPDCIPSDKAGAACTTSGFFKGGLDNPDGSLDDAVAADGSISGALMGAYALGIIGIAMIVAACCFVARDSETQLLSLALTVASGPGLQPSQTQPAMADEAPRRIFGGRGGPFGGSGGQSRRKGKLSAQPQPARSATSSSQYAELREPA